MNRIDFMIRLSAMLSDLPTAEREEAIQYYEDYLNDAGVENEEEVLAALGTPEELAASIREGLKEGSEQRGEFSENGFFEKGERLENELARRGNDGQTNGDSQKADPKGASGGKASGAGFGSERNGGTQKEYGKTGEEKERQSGGNGFGSKDAGPKAGRDENGGFQGQNGAGYGPSYGAHRSGRGESLHERYRGRQRKNASSFLILLCILASPVLIPVVFSLAVVAVVMIFVVLLLGVIFLFTGVICVIAGIAALVEALTKLFLYPAGAVLIIGISLMVIGFGMLFTVAVGGLIGKLVPKMVRGLTNGIGGMFRRKGGRTA